MLMITKRGMFSKVKKVLYYWITVQKRQINKTASCCHMLHFNERNINPGNPKNTCSKNTTEYQLHNSFSSFVTELSLCKNVENYRHVRRHYARANSIIINTFLSVAQSTLLCFQRRWKHDSRNFELLPELNEDELEEHHIRGTGPGGQATNKTSNCVRLTHVPTGIYVKCHETRSLEKNRQLARLRLRQKLDVHFGGENSVTEKAKRESSKKKQLKRKRTNEKLERLRAFKDREGIS